MRKDQAADLRSAYPVWIQVGTIVSLSLLIFAFRADLRSQGDFEIVMPEQEMVKVKDVQPTQQIDKPPPPKPRVPIEVPNDEVLDDADLDLDRALDLDEPAPPPPPPPAPPQDEVGGDEPEVFIIVEEDPVLIGGLEELQKKIRYPEMARKASVEGRVYVTFVVDENGNVRNPVVTRGIGAGCDEEALRAIKEATFKPGKQRGRPVSVQVSLPVTFKLR